MADLVKPSPENYERALGVLGRGGLVILPTETVYGVAASASNPDAIARIYEIKSRPKDKPLSAVIFSQKQGEELGVASPLARDLMQKFWPGPLTLVLPLRKGANIHKSALSGQNTVGLRYPDIEWAEAIRKLGFTESLVLPSANTSGIPAPTDAHSAKQDIGNKVDLILDGGQCAGGVESTIISVINNTAKVLRRGAIPPEALAEFPIEWPAS